MISTKLSTPPASVKPNSHPNSPLHPRHRHTQSHPSPPATPKPTMVHSRLPLNASVSLEYAPAGSCNHVADAHDHVVCASPSSSDVKEPTSSNDVVNSADDVRISGNRISAEVNSISSPRAVSQVKTVSCLESPALQKKVNSRSTLSRSTSDNFHRRQAKANGRSSPCATPIGFHSLDDASLAQLVAAKKAAASDLSLQRKLRVLEYGRKPGKHGRVCPDVPSLTSVNAEPQRCKFITAQSDPLYVAYHDEEWGVPVHDDRSLFELLVLAGAQVELSWTTILQKREPYRNVFCGYDPAVVATFKERHIQSLEADKTLLLQGSKIRGVVENAQRVLEVVKEFGSLDTYFWSFMNYKPMINDYRYPKQLPAKTSKSEFISKDLVRRGFRFVGPTIVYSFMQAAGMTNDHLVQCFRHKACMTLIGSSQDNTDEIKSEVSLGLGDDVESDFAVSHVDDMQLESTQLLQELELQTHHVSQQFTPADCVHIEAY
ncbi:hypothetical protein L7F22_064582 [Adiantum nelumboides]|nr:hypothetical protein [Adiantum nelumboides]